MSALRSIAAYAGALATLMPRGRVWPEAGGRVWSELTAALAAELRRLDARALKVLDEADARTTTEGLGDWERVLGLPDDCAPALQSIAERREAVVALLRAEGGASRAYFIGLAAALGFAITITEHRPFRCGVSRCGGQEPRHEIGSPLMRFTWRVRIANRRLSYFRMGVSRMGRDRLGSIELATALECLFERLKPTQTRIVFDYAPVAARDYSADYGPDYGG